METFLIKALQLVVALSLLVVIHEFGHYFFARLFGIRVEKFYLFFNPWFTPFKWKPKPPKKRKYKKDGTPKASWRDTEYGIGWLPLGGYCKIAGMIDESMDKEQMAQEAKPDEFRSRPAWQRLLVMVGGVLFNFILALIIYIGITWWWGEGYIPYENSRLGMLYSEAAHEAGYQDGDIILAADGEYVSAEPFAGGEMKIVEANDVTVLRGNDTITVHNPEDFIFKLGKTGFFRFDENSKSVYRYPVVVGRTSAGTAAAEAGLEPMDQIITVNGETVESFEEFKPMLLANNGKEIELGYVRGNDTLVAKVVPENGLLGFGPLSPYDIYDSHIYNYTLLQAIPKGISNGTNQLVTYVSSLKHLFTKEGVKQVGGFGSIGDLFPAKWDWHTFWYMAAFLSLILAFMNILPIPALDGGHVMFVLWEMITRRKPSEKFLERAQIAGMIFLILLLVYANFNDIYKFIFK